MMVTFFRILGGIIMAYSFFYLILPKLDTKASLGIIILLIGYYLATGLVYFDLGIKKNK